MPLRDASTASRSFKAMRLGLAAVAGLTAALLGGVVETI